MQDKENMLRWVPMIGLVFGLVISPACDVSPVDDGDEGYFLGLSEAELRGVWAVTDVDMTVDDWLDRHAQPFGCEDYGDLCEAVGTEAAQQILRESYERLLAGDSADAVQSWFESAVDTAIEQWSAVDDGEDEFRAYQQSFNTQGGRRTRVRAFSFWPTYVTAGYAYTGCMHQVKLVAKGPWVNVPADMKASVRSRRINNGFALPPIPSATGYTQNQAIGAPVTSGTNYHGFLTGYGSSQVIARGCCQTFGQPGFTSNIWCVGSTDP
ncbi:MAG: hypothetical protein K0V04_44320 [Deltaproteobacteria bacterium]|nr:hypothetical protein [Deltaproteobacteria bacterium]